jgi:hypothetical protein
MVIMIVPELLFPDASRAWRFSRAVLAGRSTGVGGFSFSGMPADPGEEAVAIKKGSTAKKIPKSEAKHRKRSVFMAVQSLP